MDTLDSYHRLDCRFHRQIADAGKDPGGIVITILLGVAGSIAATFLGKLLGLYNEGDSAGFIASILGAMLLLWIYRLVKGKQQQASA